MSRLNPTAGEFKGLSLEERWAAQWNREQVLWFLRELSTPADFLQALEKTLTPDERESWNTEKARRAYNAEELQTDDCGMGDRTSDFFPVANDDSIVDLVPTPPFWQHQADADAVRISIEEVEAANHSRVLEQIAAQALLDARKCAVDAVTTSADRRRKN